jgi:hypothetical protein
MDVYDQISGGRGGSMEEDNVSLGEMPETFMDKMPERLMPERFIANPVTKEIKPAPQKGGKADQLKELISKQ